MSKLKHISMAEKELRFAREYHINGNNAAQAALFVGYAKSGDRNQGNRMLKRPGVQAELDILRKKATKKYEYSLELAMKDLERVEKIAAGAPVPMPDGSVKQLPVPNPAVMLKVAEQRIRLFDVAPPPRVILGLDGLFDVIEDDDES